MSISRGRAPRRAVPWRGRAWAVALAVSAAAGGAGFLSWPAPRAEAAGLQPRPNVVVIETDDQTVESMKVMSTVNQRIAARGVTFPNSFVNFSLCCPSRATFLTGQYAHNHRVLGNAPPLGGFLTFEGLYADNNLAVWLQRAGYRTALIGKYLNGYYADPVEPPGWSEWDAGIGGEVYDYDVNENGQIVHYGTEASDFKQDVLTGKAIEFVHSGASRTEPFFLWLAYSSPHTNGPDPNPQPPSDCDGAAKPAPRDADAFASEPLPTPPSFNEADVSDKPEPIRSLPLLTGSEIAETTRRYRCALESLLSVDRGVGKLLTALKRSGELANTYVIYTSDNGFFNGAHRVAAGKVKLYEESIRVPLVIRGPGLPHGRSARDLAINADLAPTIIQATGATIQATGATPGPTMDGRTLLDAARHPNRETGRELVVEARRYRHAPGFKGVRTRRYLYARHGTDEEELYDLVDDPFELQNAAHDPAYAAVRSELAHELEKLKRCAGSDCRTAPRVSLRLDYRRRRQNGRPCALDPIRALIGGAEADDVVEAEFRIGGLPVADDTEAPFERLMFLFHGRIRVEVRVSMLDGRRITIDRRLRACG